MLSLWKRHGGLVTGGIKEAGRASRTDSQTERVVDSLSLFFIPLEYYGFWGWLLCLLRLFYVYSSIISPHEADGIQEVSGLIPLISTKAPRTQGLIVIRYYLALRGAENGVTVMVTPFFCVQG